MKQNYNLTKITTISLYFLFLLPLFGMEINNRQPDNLLIEAEQRLSWFQKDAHFLIEDGFAQLVQMKDKESAINRVKSRLESMMQYIKNYDVTDSQDRLMQLREIQDNITVLGKRIDAIMQLNLIRDEETHKQFLDETEQCETILSNWMHTIISIKNVTTNRIQNKALSIMDDLESSAIAVNKEIEILKAQEAENPNASKSMSTEELNQRRFYIKCFSYTQPKNWSIETKVYILQMLFWNAHINQEVTKQVLLSTVLSTIAITPELNATPPDILSNYGEKERPKLTYKIRTIPDDAPDEIKKLFHNFAKERKELKAINASLRLKIDYNAIKERKHFLQSEEFKKVVAKIEESYAQKNGIIEDLFDYSPYYFQRWWLKKQEELNLQQEELDMQKAHKVYIAKKEDTTKPLSEEQKAKMSNDLKITEKEKMKRKEYNERRRNIHNLERKTIQSRSIEERLREKIEKNSKKDQEILDKTIEKELSKIQKSIAKINDQNSADIVSEKIIQLQQYASKDNVYLQSRLETIDEALRKKASYFSSYEVCSLAFINIGRLFNDFQKTKEMVKFQQAMELWHQTKGLWPQHYSSYQTLATKYTKNNDIDTISIKDNLNAQYIKFLEAKSYEKGNTAGGKEEHSFKMQSYYEIIDCLLKEIPQYDDYARDDIEKMLANISLLSSSDETSEYSKKIREQMNGSIHEEPEQQQKNIDEQSHVFNELPPIFVMTANILSETMTILKQKREQQQEISPPGKMNQQEIESSKSLSDASKNDAPKKENQKVYRLTTFAQFKRQNTKAKDLMAHWLQKNHNNTIIRNKLRYLKQFEEIVRPYIKEWQKPEKILKELPLEDILEDKNEVIDQLPLQSIKKEEKQSVKKSFTWSGLTNIFVNIFNDCWSGMKWAFGI